MASRIGSVLMVAAVQVACSHTYIYGPMVPPTIEGRELIVPRHAGEISPASGGVVGERFTIEAIAVPDLAVPGGWRRANSGELELLRAGVVPEGLDQVRVEVDNSGVIWRDWAAAGFGIGVSTVLAMFALTGVTQPGDGGDGVSFPLTVLIAAALGTEFVLVGAAMGVGFEGGDTDLRFGYGPP